MGQGCGLQDLLHYPQEKWVLKELTTSLFQWKYFREEIQGDIEYIKEAKDRLKAIQARIKSDK